MKKIRELVLIVGVIGVVVALAHADPALAVNGEAQAQNVIKNLIKTMIGLAGAVAVIFVVVGGYHYITSSGHPEKLEKAKKTLLYAGIGLAIVLLAYPVVDYVVSLVDTAAP